MASTDDLVPGPEHQADALAQTALLNCLIREVARPAETGGFLLPATGRVVSAAGTRHPVRPALCTPGGRRPLSLDELIAIAADELRAATGADNRVLAAEIRHSRDVTAALLTARRSATPPADPYLRSEQALLAGHRFHPAPKARGGAGPQEWLAYAPEAYASFRLPLLGVPVEDLVEVGDTGGLDRLGGTADGGLVPLPAHPWQVRLLGGLRHLRRLGVTAGPVVPTSSVRTVYVPEADLFCKFSLDVRITNDVRRLWLHDLRRLPLVAALVDRAFDGLPEQVPRPAVLRDRGYRSARLGADGGEALAVIVRDGLRAHLHPGLTALLAAGIGEGFAGNPLDDLDEDRSLLWWERYLEHVVPPVLHAYLRHGVVLECHLQNVLVGVDAGGMPAQALFRDHEGVKLVAERHPGLEAPVLGGAQAWERLVYCLVTNNLCEIAGAVAERHPKLGDELWARARAVFAVAAKDHGDPAELRELLAATHIPAKANLLLRWLEADGAAMRWVPVPNPLRLFTP
ncbi:IucA/IucC family siderophore biosynthesis protein [Nonomuraea terrae]|uniref:IucA/IucC family siderophore biosynthesis protein n=1 Tax=Nonomuraea terrae TaxID=2530383 RepID=A0A4R4YMH7_9ACTN|nr:IucA/IucC family C-terminal-domain containing protein [Nonomuraea terrae]TDD46255.1 IucA/IucC family siderophore biosynthesis protein [Nonomuraea terrae]